MGIFGAMKYSNSVLAVQFTNFCRRSWYKKGERDMSLEHILYEQFWSLAGCSYLNPD